MNLQQIPLHTGCLFPGVTRRLIEVNGHDWLGWCSCGTRIKAGVDFADLDGRPFRSYYCARCAARLTHLTKDQQP